MSTVPIMHKPVVQPAIKEEFERLAKEWHDVVEYHSSTSVRNGHPAYKRIIALGSGVVPLLLRDMEENHTHWFYALRAITGANPIPPSSAGNIPQMVQAWLGWAKDNGYQW